MWRIACAAALTVGLVSSSGFAQVPSVSVEPVKCFPEEENGIVTANVSPEVGGATTRLYFRWNEHGAFYWVDMVAAGGGNYWGIPPRAEERNDEVEYYIAVLSPEGNVLGRSESFTAPVWDSPRTRRERDGEENRRPEDEEICEIVLDERQFGFANNLTIGETAEAQEGRELLGWLCDGVVTRVNFEDIMRPDEICRGCVIPWWQVQEYIIPAVGVAAGSVLIIEDPDGEASPSRP